MKKKNNLIPVALFVLSLLGTLISLFVSEALRIPPCSLCWIQRFFLFPQVFLYGISYIKRTNWYFIGLPLSLIGGSVAFYQAFFVVDTEGVSCTIGNVSDCSNPVFTFGFLTFPFLSFLLFLVISLLVVVYLLQEKRGDRY